MIYLKNNNKVLVQLYNKKFNHMKRKYNKKKNKYNYGKLSGFNIKRNLLI